MEVRIIDDLKQNFMKDLLYCYLLREGFKEEKLFPSFFNWLNKESVYSTPEAAEILGMNENTLRYQIRIMQSLNYIENLKAGRNYRFDYINIYRMFLVKTILNLPNRNTGDIANILSQNELQNTEEEVSSSIETEYKNEMDSINEFDLAILEKQLAISELQMNAFELNKMYLQLDQSFNLLAIENKIYTKVNEVLKQSNKRWFKKLSGQEAYLLEVNAAKQLVNLKDELNEIHIEINKCEKNLALECYELQSLIERKRSILISRK